METHTHEQHNKAATAVLYKVVAILFVGITVIYPLAYIGMMYMATKLS
jgi:hypothetical protein